MLPLSTITSLHPPTPLTHSHLSPASLPALPHRRKLIENEPRSREVVEYRIFLDDDQLKATVKVDERRKALLEGIRLNRVCDECQTNYHDYNQLNLNIIIIIIKF